VTEAPATPLISVVIPTRNRWPLLRQTLAGVLRQEEVELEVVVVDDGSEDGTSARLAEIGDPRVRVHRHEQGSGVARARNAGIELARGKWLAFLDDDDLWSPRKLRVQLDTALAGGGDWVLGAAVVVDENRRVVGMEPPQPVEDIPRLLLTFNAVPGGCSGVMARTDLVRQVGGFDEEMRIMADWDLWIRLSANGRLSVSPGQEIAYVKHAQNMTAVNLAGIVTELEALAAKHRSIGFSVDGIWFSRWLAGNYRRSGQPARAIGIYLDGAVRYRSPGNVVRAVGTLTGERAMRRIRQHRPAPVPTSAPAWLALYL